MSMPGLILLDAFHTRLIPRNFSAKVLSLRDRVSRDGWSGDDLKLEEETYYLRRMYSVSSDVSQFEWEAPR